MQALTILLAAFALFAGVQDKPVKFPKVGAKYTLESKMQIGNETMAQETVWEVTKTEDDKCTVVLENGEIMIWSYTDGYYVWGNEDGSAQALMFKLGAKKGDSWNPRKGDETGTWTMTYAGDEDVKVAAGTYKGCLRLELTRKGAEMKIIQWFSPEVGMVKGAKEISGTVVATVELKKYEAGK